MARSSATTCDTCGTEMPSDAPLGLCPRCLLQTGSRLVREQLSENEGGDVNESTPTRAPGCIGDYELIEEIGRGGMGVVFKARQLRLNRIVAVKTILAGEFASPAALLRFRLEAEAAATLRHPGIVGIHETGEHDGRPFFSMEFVEGRSLESLAKEETITPHQAARYLAKIALAVQAAHERGVLHRDLKPSNVLVDQDDEPRITDFGLAKRLRVESDVTLSGQMLGSPNFMPPEQVSSRHGKLSVRSDVYALGATLYFLLTGHPPFQAPTVPETLRKVTDEEAPSPRNRNPGIPADLATICLKCLEKSADRRYGSAGEVAEDLQRFLDGEPVLARQVGPATRLWKLCQRKPLLASLSATVSLLLLAFLVGAPVAYLAIREQRDHANALLYAADMNLAFQALKENRLDRVRELLERHRPKPGDQDLRGWEWGHLWHESQSDELASWEAHETAITALAFSPDGRWLASGGGDRTLRVWDVATRGQIALVNCGGVPTQAAFTPDGRRVLAIMVIDPAVEPAIRIWETGTWREQENIRPKDHVRSFAISPDGRRLAVQTIRGQVTLTDFATGELVTTLVPPHEQQPPLRGLTFAADAPILAVPESGGVGIWDVTRLRKLRSEPYANGNHRFKPYPIVLAPDGAICLIGGLETRAVDLRGATDPVVLTESLGGTVGAAFSPNGDKVALADASPAITVWDTTTWEQWAGLRGQKFDATELAFSPRGDFLASAGPDGSIRFWNTATPPARRPTAPLPADFRSLWMTSSSTILYWMDDREILIQTGMPTPRLIRRELPEVPGNTPAVSPEARYLCVERPDGQCEIREVATMRLLVTLQGSRPRVSDHVSFSPDEKMLVGSDHASGDRVVWTVEDGREVARIAFGERWFPLFSEVWCPDSRQVLPAGDTNLGLWDIESNALVYVVPHGSGPCGAAMSPDGRFIASLDGSSNVRLWDARNGTLITVLGLRGPSRRWLYPLSFSPDSRRLAVAGGLNGFRLYDLFTGQELGTPDMDFLPQGCLFSEDGRWLSIGGGPGFNYFYSTPIALAKP